MYFPGFFDRCDPVRLLIVVVYEMVHEARHPVGYISCVTGTLPPEGSDVLAELPIVVVNGEQWVEYGP